MEMQRSTGVLSYEARVLEQELVSLFLCFQNKKKRLKREQRTSWRRRRSASKDKLRL
jgi:hypothetical protein